MAAIGVLALQGAFERHAIVLERLGHRPLLVRAARDFEGLCGLILPGGESTVQLKLLERLGLEEPLCALVREGIPVLATCAGLILAAKTVTQPSQRSLGFVDVAVARNAFGSQVESFEAASDEGKPLVFVRAPRVVHVGAGVEILGRFRGEPILLRQRSITCATFHPELTDDPFVHEMAFGLRPPALLPRAPDHPLSTRDQPAQVPDR